MLQGEAEAKAGEGADKKAPEEDYYIYANVLLNWGNILYERSQLAARAGQVRCWGAGLRSLWRQSSVTAAARWQLTAGSLHPWQCQAVPSEACQLWGEHAAAGTLSMSQYAVDVTTARKQEQHEMSSSMIMAVAFDSLPRTGGRCWTRLLSTSGTPAARRRTSAAR